MNRVRVGGRQPTTTTSSVEASDGEPSNGSRKLRSAGKNWLLQSAQWSKSYDSVINYWNTSRTTAAGSYETRSAAASPGSMGYSPPGGTIGPAGGQSADRFSGRLSASTTTLAAGQPAGGLNGNDVKHGVSPSSSLASKLHRKVLRVPAKRIPGKVLHHHHHPGKLASVASKLTAAKQRLQQQQQAQQLQQFNLQQQQQQQRPVGSSTSSSSSSSANVNNCDNSNDSGLGFDRSLDSAAALGAAQFQNGTNPHHTSTGRPIQHSSNPDDDGVDSESGWSTTSSGNGHSSAPRRIRGGGKPASMFGGTRRTTSRSSVASSRSSSTTSNKSLKRTHLELEDSAACSGALFALSTGKLTTTKLQASKPIKPMARTVVAPKKIIIPVHRTTPAGKSTITIATANSTSLSLQAPSSSSPQSSPQKTAAAAPAKVMTSSASRSLNRLPGKRPPMLSGSLGGGGGPVSGGGPFSNSGVVTLQSQLGCSSRDGKIQLQILTQPEQQHRARYQTEGSRGAVKDRSGNGFPVVRLVGHNKPAVLQVFIGTDVGRVAPHMFYQACKVSGKNSTPCVERKLEGTMVIEVDMKPDGDMTVTCDCVGILKERNVDVEHRFPDQSGPRAKKKSTRCRMVFRAAITHDDGSVETLQVCSQQIVCTQPPGVPEICKKSLVSCPAEGGLELFIVGKNFLKDTKVVFQRRKAPLGGAATAGGISVMPWEQTVIPDKEYLQQTHLICTVPPYISQDICEPVVVQIFIVSAGKRSETHNFTFTPKGHHTALSASTTTTGSFFGLGGGDEIGPSGPAASVGGGNTGPASFNSLNSSFSSNQSEDVSASSEAASAKKSLFLWGSQLANAAAVQETLDTGMMPPPVNVLPLSGGTTSRRPSLLVEQLSNMSSPPNFKAELLDESSRSPNNEDSLDRFPDSTDNSIDNSHILYRRRSVRQPSMDMMDESSSMSMLINENSAMDCGSGAGGPMMGFRSGLSTLMETNEVSNSATSPSACELKVMNLCIKQEQQMSATTRNQIEQMIATTSNLGNLNEINQIKAQLNVEGMLNAAVSPGGSLEKPPGMLEINSVVSLASNASHSPTSTVMMHNEMPGGATNTNHSPLSQDVMLNSQSTITVPSPGNLVLSSPGSSNEVSPHPHASISPDIILNPTISPTSMMCTPSNATVAATAAAAVAAAAAVSDGAAGLLSNQVFNNMAAVAANMIENQPQETTQAVQEIILNAAAEILTSQEPSVTTQSTINALISMNAQEMMTTSCQPQTQAIMSQQTLMSQCQPTAMMTAESMANALQQQQQQQQIVHNMLTESLHQQQQQATESLMLNLAAAAAAASQQQQQQSVPEQMEIGNPIMSSTVTSTVPQQQQPPQQPMDTSPTQQQQQQIPTQMVVETAGGIQEQQQQQAVAAAAAAAAVGANASIPQELTIMSDNDLISYINPNAFDAV
ncbi:nuclear factor of activated T-cells 5 isoform X4 [Culex pipiens pallens]|uniref:nuclear factor of activated T-cells 5 isoform X4 n=1 Tax=Culex pipiens pallens TaxID=42434 RepID=UPI0022AA7696|nr:nuclear factor of activated T-cells 5 isoform X4 [Culex pipiens pallens]